MTSGAYLDAASSEPLHPAAREVLLAALDQGYADPRRLHRAGRSARLLLDNARAVVAEALEVRPDEVSFTASGTAAVHLGLLGLHRGARDGRIAHTAVEHSAVLHAAQWTGGAAELPVDALGRVEVAPPPGGTSVLAVQAANHEVGTLQPVA
jgi:cysteine desulfurase